MKTLSLAAALVAASFLLAPSDAAAQSHGGHMMGGGHAGGGHFVGSSHGGFRHDGRAFHGGHFHGGHFGAAFVVGGIWYPWYAYPAPVYASTWYYYCPSAGAYYPQVTYCPEPWVAVAP